MIYTKKHPHVKRIVLLILLFSHFSAFSQIQNEDSLIKILRINDNPKKISALISFIDSNFKSNPELCVKYESELLRLDPKDQSLKSNALFKLAYAHINLRNYTEAEALLNAVIELRENIQDQTGVADAKSQLAYTYYRTGQIQLAYDYICQAQTISELEEDTKQMATDMYRRGVFAKNLGMYEEAILYYNKAIEVYKKKNDQKTVGNLLANIGNVFIKLNQGEKALNYHLEALDIYHSLNDSSSMAGVLNDLGNDYYYLKNDSLALEYYFMAYEINQKTGNDIWQAYNLSNIGTIYTDNGKYDEAIVYLHRSIALKENAKDQKSLVTSYATLGDVYQQKGKYKEALEYLLKSNQLAEQIGAEISVVNVLKNIAWVYSKQKNYQQAYEFQKKYSTIRDSVFNREKIEAVNEIQEKFETVEREKEIQELKFEQELHKKRQLVLIAIIVSFFIIASLIFTAVILKRKKDKQIMAQKEIVHKKEKDLAQLELDKIKLKEHDLQNELAYKSKQLTTHALNMMQKNKLFQGFQDSLKTLSKKVDTELKPDFKRIHSQINRNLKSENDWELFKMYFEEVNQNFYDKLRAFNPELTQYDLRLCALLKLNLNIKETASVLNVAPNSIKSARYRLRKKLGLKEEDNLVDFIKDFS